MADDKLRATPAARKLADDLGINLYDVSGSGANGRVHKEDVETYKDTNVVRISPLAKRLLQNTILLGKKSKELVTVVRL